MKKVVKKQRLEVDKYVNTDTGEMLSSEHPDIVSINIKDDNLVIVDSEEYMIIDSQALSYISDNFSPVDLGRILQMADMTYGEYNILFNKNVPHDNITLMDSLNYSRNKFANFMKRLEKRSIIYYIMGYKDERRVKYIMMNPHFARKRKTVHKDCLTSFQDIRKLT